MRGRSGGRYQSQPVRRAHRLLANGWVDSPERNIDTGPSAPKQGFCCRVDIYPRHRPPTALSAWRGIMVGSVPELPIRPRSLPASSPWLAYLLASIGHVLAASTVASQSERERELKACSEYYSIPVPLRARFQVLFRSQVPDPALTQDKQAA